VPPCIATIHDDGDGAVSRIRRLGKWQIVPRQFREVVTRIGEMTTDGAMQRLAIERALRGDGWDGASAMRSVCF
jgi:hypothetical protein